MGVGAIATSNVKERASRYKGGITSYVLVVAMLAAAGGMMFGYDIGVSGGVTTSPNFLQTFFPDVYVQQQQDAVNSVYCQFDSATLQLFTSSLYLAGAITSLIASWFTDKFGRKTSILIASCCFLAGVGLTAGAVALGMMIAGRLLLGVGVGFAAQAVPLFLSEMAPCSARGSLNFMFQLATTIGILVAQIINYCASLFPDTSEWQWRLPLLLAGIPAVLLFIGGIVVPDTPNSLFARGKESDARRVLERVRGVSDVDAEYDDIADAVLTVKAVSNPLAIFQRRYTPQLVHSIMIPFFQQLTGINCVMFYAAPIFKSFGWGTQAALYNTIIIGSINVLATVVAIVLVDRLGRRFLFLEGGLQCSVALGVLALLIGIAFPGDTTTASSGMAIGILITMCVFITGFAWSWGPLGWLVPSEIQPLETRSMGTSISTFINFLFTFVIGQAFLSMMCAMKWGAFLFFAAFVVAATIYVQLLVPETKGVPIEEIDLVFAAHRVWKRYVVVYNSDVEKQSVDKPSSPVSSANE